MPLLKPFYEVSPDAYLYPEKVKEAGSRKQLEEPVRQWCAYELIRAYGIAVTNIEFERPVRMGSRPHWIDILVSREGKPSVVVECKKASDRNAAKAMEQSVSYADAPGIQAEFPVFTNGTDWQVKRRIQGKWCAVPDLPRVVDQNGAEPITELLRGLEDIAPLLYKLDQQLAGKDAESFLRAMQRFFCSMNLLTCDIDRDLLIATDNLLRVISSADEHPAYCSGKLATAIKHFEAYRKQKGFGIELFFNGEPMPHEIQYLHASLLGMVEGAQGLSGGEVLLLRLDTALAEYGMRQGRRDELYSKSAPSLQQTLRDYLNYALVFHLNVSLPDHLDDIWIGDMRGYCRTAWERAANERQSTFGDFIAVWAGFLYSRIRLF